MSKFSYRAYGKDGVETKGLIEAESRPEAARLIARSGRKLIDLSEETASHGMMSAIRARTTARRPVNYHQLFSELTILLQAGFTIDAALKAIAASQKGKGSLAEVVGSIGAGSSFSEAIANLPGVDPAVVALLVSGEHSGRLDEVVTVLSTLFEEEKKRKAEIIEAIVSHFPDRNDAVCRRHHHVCTGSGHRPGVRGNI